MPQRNLIVSLFLIVCLLATPAHAEETPAVKVGLELEGRLASRTVTREGEKRTLFQIQVGKTTYELDTSSIESDALRKAKGKYVSFRTTPQDAVPEGEAGVALTKDVTFAVQDRSPLAGTVRVVQEGKKKTIQLETADGLWQVASRDAHKFKRVHGLHVEVVCYRVTDGRYRALDKVKSVERKLLPGERDPQSGEAAIGAAWMGTLTAVKVPKGIPGVKPGDFPIAFQSDASLETTEGRVMRSYDVVGLRSRKFNRKKRTATIEVAYSFGQGSYAIMLEGTFGPDWKTFTGNWKSGFLGSGTFVIALDERSKN